ncbi:MAG: zinc-dependent alcohol dehydrogenase family protein [Nitrosomonadales bacterium]|nr:zinc-dependent alcohol dehydrogenase family protein [Nitrosomonadales bacterium]
MKAVLMTAAGGPDVLAMYDVNKPELPSPHHLRVKLAAAGVNPLDTKLRTKPVYYPDKLPAILGCDGAGTVEKTGSAVTRFKEGDTVFFCNGGIGGNQGDEPGCYAEYTTVHEEYCAATPANLGLQDAAGLPLVLITAWEALVERANLQAGQTILIHGGTGGVGHIALQLAKHLGAKVAVTVSDDKKEGLAQGLEADKIVRYKEMDFVVDVEEWSGGKGVDVVLDTIGGDTFLRSMNVTRIGGKIVTLLSTPMSLEDTQKARFRNLAICYELMLTPQVLKQHDERIRQRKILEKGAQLIESGEMGVLVSYALPLREAAEAHRIIERGHVLGKIILTMG